MATNSRDVELRISATTSGEEQIRDLAKQIATLAKEGGEAAPEYKKLAAELDKIAAQKAAVDTLGQIETALVATGDKLTQAREKVETLSAALSDQRQKSEDFKAAQTQAAAGVEELQSKLREAENALRLFKATQDVSSKGNDEAKAKLVELKTAVAELKNELADQKALVATRTETREVERSLNDAAKAYSAAGKDVKALESQLSSQREEATKVKTELTSLGVATEDFGKAQDAVQQNLIDTNKSIAATQAYYADLRNEIERSIAKEKEWADVRAFEDKRQQAVKLQEAAEYVRFWTDALAKAEAAEKDFAEVQALEKKRLQAIKLQESAEYVKFWEDALAKAEAAEKDLAAVQALEQKRQEAIKLQQAAEYVNFWNKALDEAEQKERDVQAVAALEKKRLEAVKLLEAADYVKFWTNALNQAEEAERKLADEARASAKALEDAWAKTGVRSGEAIRAEIEKIVAALAALKADSKTTGADFDRAFAAAEARISRLQAELNATPEALRKTGQGVNFVKDAFRELAAVYGAFELSKAFFDANVQIETLRRSLTLITGSTEGANRQIELLRDASNKSGVAIGAITDSFVKFQASLNGAKIPLETTEGLFRAVVNASGQLGLSSQKTGLILDALAQTANKGVVSMEELRQQLGDSLPGALDLTAKGLGISTAELVKLTENGKLLAADFLPALRKSLVETFGDGSKQIEGLGASFSRLKNLATEFAQTIGDSGVGTGLIAAFKAFGAVAGAVGLGVNTVLESAFTLVRQLATGIAAIVSGDLKNLGPTLQKIADDSIARQVKAVEAYREFIGASDKASVAQGNLADKVTQAGKAGEAAAAGVDKATGAQTSNTAAANTNATANEKAAAAVEASGKAADLATPGWVKLTNEFQKANEALALQIKISETSSDAIKLEGDARRQLADIAGNEAQKLKVSAETRQLDADALERTAKLRRAEVDLLTSERDQLVDLKNKLGDTSGARQEAIDKIQKSIDVKDAEAKKSEQAADAARREALARSVTLKAYEDNSNAIQILAAAYESAKTAATVANAAERAGLATKKDSQAANERLAEAEFLYRDAVSDSARALDSKNKLLQAGQTLAQGKINIEKTVLENEIALAAAQGNTAKVIDNTIKLKQLEIRTVEEKNKVLSAEAKATIAVAQEELKSLEATQSLTPAKRDEIEARILAAKAKLLESDRGQELIKGLRQEIELIRQRSGQYAASVIEYETNMQREKAATEEAAAAERKRREDQIVGSYQLDALQTLLFKKRAGILDANDANLAKIALQVARDNFTTAAQSQGVSLNALTSYRQAVTDAENVLGTITGIAQTEANRQQQERQQQQAPRPPAPAPAAAPGGAYTVNINLGGSSTTIRTASDSDAVALTNLLQQIGRAAGRTGP
jgi:tape measure domain-containing protein